MGAERISPTELLTGSPSRRTALLWVAGWLIFFGGMSYSAALQKCATYDEPLHAVSGAAIREYADYRIDDQDPTLFEFFTTLANRGDALKIDTNSAAWVQSPKIHHIQWQVATDTLYRTPGNDGAGYVNRSRFLFMLLGVGLGALMSFWAYRLAGALAAMMAATMYALDPNFLAHASLVKNDVPSALLMLWLAYSLWLIGQRISILRVVWVALCCTVAINVKFSGMLFGPIAVAVLVVRAAMPWAWKAGRRKLTSVWGRLATAMGVACAIGVMGWAVTWAIYAPDRSPPVNWLEFIRDVKMRSIQIADPQVKQIRLSQLDAMAEPKMVRALEFAHDHHLMPRSWLSGFLYTYDSAVARSTFLLGKHSVAGWWYYFPLAMAFKTPLTILGLMGIGAALGVAGVVRKGAKPRAGWEWVCLWVPIGIYGIAALTTNLNLGIRHVLPVYPLIYLLIACALAKWARRSRVAVWVMGVALIGLMIETLPVWPDYIPFFNAACGGSRGGIRLLGDSNLDWGQDLPALAAWQRENPTMLLYLSYFGTVDPRYYHIDFIDVPIGYQQNQAAVAKLDRRGVLAISATNLQGIYYSKPDSSELQQLLMYLRQKEPMRVLGGSIYLFEWDPADFAAFVARR